MEVLRPPRALVVGVSGINCDGETAYAFEKAGADAQIIQINRVKSGKYKISDYQIIVLSGGFSFGDDLGAGRMMANELRTYFSDELMEHVYEKGRLVVGICNGAQDLVQLGLPLGPVCGLKDLKASLEINDSGHFESRWIWVKKDDGEPLALPVGHGEGKFVASKEVLKEIETKRQVALRYCKPDGKVTMDYPDNPNGSLHAIAGMWDPTGRVFWCMPHPERLNPKTLEPAGIDLIKELVNLAKESY